MQYVQRLKILVLMCSLLLIMVSCEYEGPDEVWDPDYEMGATPVINSVSPENVAVAGVTEITLNGSNFSTNPSANIVYFGNVRVDVKSATADQLVVYRPNLTADDFSIKVAVEGIVLHAQFSPYSVESIGGLLTEVKAVGKANTLAIDATGNLMVHVDKKNLYQVLANGDLGLLIENTKPRVVYDMKMGPGGYIYFSRDQNYINRVLLTGGEFENYANGTPGKVRYFDWDANLVMYAGGENSGLIRIKPDDSFDNLGVFTDFDIRSIRVFGNAVYIAGYYTGSDASIPAAGVWKVAITSADGDVGQPVLVLDWTQTGDFTQTEIADINFDENGVMYVATDGGTGNTLDPMLIMTPDGTIDTFYKGGLLKAPIYDLVWGNDASLYYIRATGDINLYEIHRLTMAANGAPEYGRMSISISETKE